MKSPIFCSKSVWLLTSAHIHQNTSNYKFWAFVFSSRLTSVQSNLGAFLISILGMSYQAPIHRHMMRALCRLDNSPVLITNPKGDLTNLLIRSVHIEFPYWHVENKPFFKSWTKCSPFSLLNNFGSQLGIEVLVHEMHNTVIPERQQNEKGPW